MAEGGRTATFKRQREHPEFGRVHAVESTYDLTLAITLGLGTTLS
jgi:hypothetical protein